MFEIVGIAFDLFTAIAYLVVGAREVRRAHGLAGGLFVGAGVLVLATMCAWRAGVAAGLTSSHRELLVAGTIYGVVRGLFVSGLLIAALVMLARKLERLRSPTQF